MANLTRSERHNRMLNKTFEHYRLHQSSVPTGCLYDRFLEIAEEKLNIPKDEAISKYGHYTVHEWETLLKLGWNKVN